ncbi:hypothetical protein [Zhongshania aquimaris]|uniref:Uncharacterized protein n=1 Tax=Zhongshania aquimaris TaxID=2857107 RepID=A0ABS6VUH5_9GAMM|nr:hypothetical protein [Zhongshania aquimaris]MBW2941974.1 hypothetical protein [Zhongshania aquimaris]
MKESFRGQSNLHIYFAEQYLTQLETTDKSEWGGHFHRATAESLIWQLLLAYQCHLADLLEQQPKFGLRVPAGHFNARSFTLAELPPEILELADREVHSPWLKSLVDYPFLQTVGSSPSGLIASDATRLERIELDFAECLAELKSVIARHRATLMEY